MNKGGRRLNEYTVGVTKNWEHIPDSHECKDCYRNKTQVNFYVRESNNASGWYTAVRCNQCVSLHSRGVEGTKEYNRPEVRCERQRLFIKKFKEMIWNT